MACDNEKQTMFNPRQPIKIRSRFRNYLLVKFISGIMSWWSISSCVAMTSDRDWRSAMCTILSRTKRR